jgi:hypothetical protein
MESVDNHRFFPLLGDKYKSNLLFRHNPTGPNWRLAKLKNLSQSPQGFNAQLEDRAQFLCLICKLQLQHTPSTPGILLFPHDMTFSHIMLPMLLVELQSLIPVVQSGLTRLDAAD